MKIKKYFCAVTAALTLLGAAVPQHMKETHRQVKSKKSRFLKWIRCLLKGKDLCEAVRLHTSGFFDASGSTM